MTNIERRANITLFALAILSMMFGMVLLETLWFLDQMPAWNLLPAFFGMAVVFKVAEALQKQEIAKQVRPRVVTVEFRWNPNIRRRHYGYVL